MSTAATVDQGVHEGVGPDVWALVIQDMRDRDELGAQKYNKHLRCFDGRNTLIDAYQEALDQAVYLRKKIQEDFEELRAPEMQIVASKMFGEPGRVSVEHFWGADGLRHTTFFVGTQVDEYSWHERGRGLSWEEAFAAAGVII